MRGGSTISQQTAKNVFLWQGSGWTRYVRKVPEVYFTFLIETFWGKRRIMEIYLNVAETGIGTYGAEAGAQRYFNKSAANLSRVEAARMAAGAGAEVTVVNRSLAKLRALEALMPGRIRTRPSTRDAIDDELAGADVVIGAALVAGASTPRLITRPMLKSMKPRSVIVDISIDQGGCCETSRPTTHADPTYEVDDIVHYCVANMPGAVPRTSSHALNLATLPYGLALAERGLDALRSNAALRAGLNLLAGRVTHPMVARALGREFVDPVQALAG